MGTVTSAIVGLFKPQKQQISLIKTPLQNQLLNDWVQAHLIQPVGGNITEGNTRVWALND